jgi:poly(A) polymerase
VSFSDDPLRMLRAARFVARFDLQPRSELVAAVTRLGERLVIVSAERIHDEVSKLLHVDDPTPGLRFLADAGLLPRILPEAGAGALAAVGDTPVDLGCRLAVLLAGAGPEGARRRMARLRASSLEARDVVALVDAVDRIDRVDWDDAAARRWAGVTGAARHRALVVGRALGRPGVDELAAQLSPLDGAEDLDDLDGPLDGRAVLELLGLDEGPLVGEALAVQREARLREGPLTAERAAEVLREWWSQRER